MDADFDFLRYLDFGNAAVGGGLDANSLNEGHTSGSSSSAYLSPVGRPSSDWSASSPSSSSASYGKSPAFSTHAFPALPHQSLFDASAPFAWDLREDNSSIASDSINANSPPFDTSVLSVSPTWATLDHTAGRSQIAAAPWPSTAGASLYPPSLSTHSGALNSNNQHSGNVQTAPDPSATLAQQWQALMLQQAQLQIQMQLQSGGPAPAQHLDQHSRPSDPSMQHASQLPDYGPSAKRDTALQAVASRATHNSNSSNHFSSQLPVQTFAPVSSSTQTQAMPPRQSVDFTGMNCLPSVLAPVPSQMQPLPSSSLDTATSFTYNALASVASQAAGSAGSEGAVAVTPSGAVKHVPSVRATPVTKTGIKRSYTQIKQEDGADASTREASSMSRSVSQESQDSNADASNGGKKGAGRHNAVEQKYRRGINDSLITLREIVPALQHLRAVPGSEAAQRKQSQFSLAASVTPAAPSHFVDGVPAPNKLSKQLILVTATDYIRFLQNRREELEGELSTLKQAMHDCVEDPQIVFQLAEQRWAPTRASILRARHGIYNSRVADKEQSKQQAKLERQQNAKARRAARNQAAANGEVIDSASDGEDSEDNEHDVRDDLADGRANNGADMSVSQPARKVQKKSHKPSDRPSGANANRKALYSVFAGVTFAGGASYDLIFGSSASSGTQGVSPGQVWSRSNILKRDTILADRTDSLNLSPIQTFFITRPALLTGLLIMGMSTLMLYLFTTILTGASRNSHEEHPRAAARRLLAKKATGEAEVSLTEERRAVTALSGVPASPFHGTLYSLKAILSLAWAMVIGTERSKRAPPPTHRAEAVDSIGSERVIASILLVQSLGAGQSYIQRVLDLAHLHWLYTHSAKWPQGKQSQDLTVRAEMAMAVAALGLFGERSDPYAERLWARARDSSTKEGLQHGWLRLALSADSSSIRKTCMDDTASCGRVLAKLADQEAYKILHGEWSRLFTDVLEATYGKGSKQSTANIKDDSVAQLLACMPSTSAPYALCLLYRGVQLLKSNNKAGAVTAAQLLGPEQIASLSSAQAFMYLVSGASSMPPNMRPFNDCDALACATVSWLSLWYRTLGARSLGVDAKNTAIAHGGSAEDATFIQVQGVWLRKLLGSEAFSISKDLAFIDAQEKCIEEVEAAGRQAAGLDTLSDSGCEL